MIRFSIAVLSIFAYLIAYQSGFTVISIPNTLEKRPVIAQPISTPILKKIKVISSVDVMSEYLSFDEVRRIEQEKKQEAERVKQATCLYEAINGEVANGTLRAKEHVANVILNRVESNRYKNTICGVIYDDSQFSYVDDHNADRVKKSFSEGVYKNLDLYKSDCVIKNLPTVKCGVTESILVGKRVLKQKPSERMLSTDVLHYYAYKSITPPYWAKYGKEVAKDSSHVFLEGVP